jgi:phosphopantothenoylcysteine decarboxylase/phosphopantothenate--cysteine ligase
MEAKNIDMIAANLVGQPDGGFESENNSLVVLWADGRRFLPMMPKTRLADVLADLIVERYVAQAPGQDT